MADIKETIKTRHQAAENYLATKRDMWGEYEDLLHGKLSDALSGSTKSQVFDPKLSTLLLDRSARVMSQLPTGKVKPISKNDNSSAQLMNLILDKYIVPNANAQFDFLTKCRMVDLYSNVYGNFFVMVDWDVKPNGYIGPDMWLIPIRDVFPQVGAYSLEDSDYVIVRTWRPLSFFEGLKKQDGFKNVELVLTKLKELSGSKQARSSGDKSNREEQQYDNADPAKGKGYFEVLSMYERDRWTDYCVDADEVFRDGPNPHKDDELPLVNKYSIPLLEDFIGLGDMERGKTMQYTLNSLWNLYLDGVKVSIFPPTLINKDNVADPNSIKFSAAAKWLMRNDLGNSAQVLNMTPQGTNTFNNTYQLVTSSLLNMMGTTDTSVQSDTDPGFGKTPQALKMQASRENARDSVDRFYMEQFLTKVNKKFINLISKKQSKAIAVRLFEPEIAQLQMQDPSIGEMYNEKTGKLSIGKGKVGSTLYDYEIISGSTYAIDEKQQQQNMMGILEMVTNPQTSQIIGQALQQEGKTLKIGELFTRIVSKSGITDWDKIIVDRENDPDAIFQDTRAQFMQALQQVGGVAGVPPQPMAAPGGIPQMGGQPQMGGM